MCLNWGLWFYTYETRCSGFFCVCPLTLQCKVLLFPPCCRKWQGSFSAYIVQCTCVFAHLSPSRTISCVFDLAVMSSTASPRGESMTCKGVISFPLWLGYFCRMAESGDSSTFNFSYLSKMTAPVCVPTDGPQSLSFLQAFGNVCLLTVREQSP